MRFHSPALLAFLALVPAGTGAAERLSDAGAALAPVAFAPGGALEARIDAGGDEVLAVHALMRPASTNQLWMRDRDGFWTEWDGDEAALLPSAARREGDDLVYKIFTAPPAGVNAMTITLAYRTPGGLKYGWFDAAERAE
ncbi:MAG: hypothetical protein WD969_00885 [Paracoccaceae bacterium]